MKVWLHDVPDDGYPDVYASLEAAKRGREWIADGFESGKFTVQKDEDGTRYVDGGPFGYGHALYEREVRS